ncbi:17.4 kDa class III heat shock protein [Abeliophyllum distichum]|uniref:17.4 kDa class III heat shock protein n=1 Tax=Abeliophyllum distichum TaxID=126358 RepID=A0ABD1VA41_9LAMI
MNGCFPGYNGRTDCTSEPNYYPNNITARKFECQRGKRMAVPQAVPVAAAAWIGVPIWEAAPFQVDILDTHKEYIFYIDVPGLTKSDIQATVEDENTLVIKSNGKRKREDGEEGCKYIRLERKSPQKQLRKFRLPENCNLTSITAKCENGVLTVVVQKLPPPPKPRTVEVQIS